MYLDTDRFGSIHLTNISGRKYNRWYNYDEGINNIYH